MADSIYMWAPGAGFNMSDDIAKKTPRVPPEAMRALEEAAERRKRMKKQALPETGGPKGEEPTRYGDWERGGRAVDF